MDPLDLTGPGFRIDQFKVFAIKSRVHFRRGFDDSGFAKTILLTEPEQPCLGTVRLEALAYPNVDISKFYPYGDGSFTLDKTLPVFGEPRLTLRSIPAPAHRGLP